MNFIRKKLSSGLQLPKANHGSEFKNKEKQYYEVENMLKKLLKDVERYIALLGEMCACKTSIYGFLFYFYSKKSAKRNIIDDLWKHHARKMEKYIHKLGQEYECNLIGEIRQILNIFPQTKKISSTLSRKKQQMEVKKQYYQSLKRPNKKVDYLELCETDEQLRILQHAYEFSVRTVIREFDTILEHKDSVLDRFCIRMLESDKKLYTNLYKTSNILRDKSFVFHYHREYPSGLPSYLRDYSYREDIQSSSDSDITAPSVNPFYDDISKQQHILIQTLTKKYGFKPLRVRSVIEKHPNASYEKLLEILTNIKRPQRYVMVKSVKLSTETKRSKTPPPPQYIHKKKPKPPKKQRALLKQMRRESKKRLLQQQSAFAQTIHFPNTPKHATQLTALTDLESDIETVVIPPPMIELMKSKPALTFLRKYKHKNTNNKTKNTRKHRVHSKSLSSELEVYVQNGKPRKHLHKRPPPPPRSKTPTFHVQRRWAVCKKFDVGDEEEEEKKHFRRSATLNSLHQDLEGHNLFMDPITFRRKMESKPPSPSDKSNISTSTELPTSITTITPVPSEDSLNDCRLILTKKNDNDALNEDEWSMPSPSFPAHHPLLPTHNLSDTSKKPKRKKKVIPQIATLIKMDNRVQPWIWNKKNIGEKESHRYDRNGNPLGLGIHTINNFVYMHQLFHPQQTRHIGDPNSDVVPNKIGMKHVVIRSVNIRKLKLNTMSPRPNIGGHRPKRNRSNTLHPIQQMSIPSAQQTTDPSTQILHQMSAQHMHTSKPSHKPQQKSGPQYHNSSTQRTAKRSSGQPVSAMQMNTSSVQNIRQPHPKPSHKVKYQQPRNRTQPNRPQPNLPNRSQHKQRNRAQPNLPNRNQRYNQSGLNKTKLPK